MENMMWLPDELEKTKDKLMKLPINASWAFKENQEEKRDENRETYNWLKPYFKYFTPQKLSGIENEELEELKKQYAVYTDDGTGYGHKRYKFLSNPLSLSNRALALVADSRNLCFGYRGSYPNIIIHTD